MVVAGIPGGCNRYSSPDLAADEAARLIRVERSVFEPMGDCVSSSGATIGVRRKLLGVESTERFPDSEGQFCYSAKVKWSWEPEKGQRCLSGDPRVYRSTAEFRFSENEWHFFSLYGEGIDGEIRPPRGGVQE